MYTPMWAQFFTLLRVFIHSRIFMFNACIYVSMRRCVYVIACTRMALEQQSTRMTSLLKRNMRTAPLRASTHGAAAVGRRLLSHLGQEAVRGGFAGLAEALFRQGDEGFPWAKGSGLDRCPDLRCPEVVYPSSVCPELRPAGCGCLTVGDLELLCQPPSCRRDRLEVIGSGTVGLIVGDVLRHLWVRRGAARLDRRRHGGVRGVLE